MLHILRRHPVEIEAWFRNSLVLTYALPAKILEPLLPPGLELDRYDDWGFLAIAMVQTEGLRPTFLPRGAGGDFFLSGYRIFTRFRTKAGRVLRGLKILRSDTDSRWMSLAGNLTTHYHYRKAKVDVLEDGPIFEVRIRTPKSEADLHVRADLSTKPAPLPKESPFRTLEDARRFAGPLPYTFDYEPETDTMVVIKGVRRAWDPQPVRVEVLECTYLERFRSAVLANAFHLSGVPYRWKRGRREPLP